MSSAPDDNDERNGEQSTVSTFSLFLISKFHVMKSQQNKDEVPQQTLILCHFHTAEHQVSGTVNVAAPEITQKCYFLSLDMFINI